MEDSSKRDAELRRALGIQPAFQHFTELQCLPGRDSNRRHAAPGNTGGKPARRRLIRPDKTLVRGKFRWSDRPTRWPGVQPRFQIRFYAHPLRGTEQERDSLRLWNRIRYN